MASLVEVLYPLPDFRRTPLTLLRWWESRRLFYNKVVGAAGLVTLAGMLVVSPQRAELLTPGALLAVGVYGLFANVCYTWGWVTEMVARAVWGRQAPDLGPLLYRQGLIFSVGLTLFPLLLTILFVVLRFIVRLVI